MCHLFVEGKYPHVAKAGLKLVMTSYLSSQEIGLQE